ncbi:MAG TPA: hypothetical protein ENN08_02845 [Bacteroidales bacterium]|nr:hypothetical protein [Bacteroidales bacterium]
MIHHNHRSFIFACADEELNWGSGKRKTNQLRYIARTNTCQMMRFLASALKSMQPFFMPVHHVSGVVPTTKANL